MTIVEILIIALAATRLTYMIMYEDGPFMIFENLRRKFSIVDCVLYETENYNFFGSMLTCFYCTSIYTSVFSIVLYLLGLQIVNIAFAVSSLVIVFLSYHEKGSNK